MGEAFIVRKGGVTTEQTLAPTITEVSTTDSSITFTIKNNDTASATIAFRVSSVTASGQTLTLAADTTSSNLTVSGLDDDTTFTVFATANVTGKIKSNVTEKEITTDVALEVPETISNLFSWYDATKITGLSNNDAVATWADSSGNNRPITQGTASKRPQFKTNVRNSLPVVRFDGTDDSLVNSVAISQANTTFLVYKFNSFASQNHMIFDGNSSTRQILFQNLQVNLIIHAGSDVNTGFNSTTNFAFTTVVFNTTSSFVRLNGSQSGTLNPGSNTRIGISLAAHEQQGSGIAAPYSNIDIAEIIIYDKVCSGTEITDVENYLKDKWGFV